MERTSALNTLLSIDNDLRRNWGGILVKEKEVIAKNDRDGHFVYSLSGEKKLHLKVELDRVEYEVTDLEEVVLGNESENRKVISSSSYSFDVENVRGKIISEILDYLDGLHGVV